MKSRIEWCVLVACLMSLGFLGLIIWEVSLMKENRVLDAKLVKMQAEIFKLENETIDLDEYCKPFGALKDGNK